MKYISWTLAPLLLSGLVCCAGGSVPTGPTGDNTAPSGAGTPSTNPAPDDTDGSAMTADGLLISARLNSGLCVGSNADNTVSLTGCEDPGALRLRLQAGQWRTKDNRCLDVQAASLAENTPLVLSPCAAPTKVPTQQWTVDKEGYLFYSSAATPSRCVFSKNGIAAASTLQLRTCNTDAVQWVVGPEGFRVRYGTSGAICLQVDTTNVRSGTPATLAPCRNVPEQRWTLASGRLRSHLPTPNLLCLDVNKNVDPGGSVLDLWVCNDAPAEAFLQHGSDGSLRLQSRPAQCASGTPPAAGAAPSPVALAPCTAATVWTFEPQVL